MDKPRRGEPMPGHHGRGQPGHGPADSPADKEVVRLERMGDVGLILVDRPPVNALSQAVRQGLLAVLRVSWPMPACTAR